MRTSFRLFHSILNSGFICFLSPMAESPAPGLGRGPFLYACSLLLTKRACCKMHEPVISSGARNPFLFHAFSREKYGFLGRKLPRNDRFVHFATGPFCVPAGCRENGLDLPYGASIILNCNKTMKSFCCLRRMPQMPSNYAWHVQILYVRMPPHFMRFSECHKHSENKTIS